MNNNQKRLSKEQIDSVMSLYAKGYFQEAIDKIKSLNIDFPNVPLLFNLIGACYQQIGQLEGAEKMFETAVNIKPDYAEAHFNHGVVLQELDKPDNAIESYKKAINFQPNYPDALNNLGKLLKESGELQGAIEKLEWAVAYQHDFAEAHNNLGLALSDYGRPIDAIKSYKNAVNYDSNYAKAYYNLAISQQNIGDKDGFIVNIEKALEIRPDMGAAHLYLSRVKKYIKTDPVIPLIESYLLKEDLSLIDRIDFSFALAHIYEGLKNYNKQFEYLNEANLLRKQEANYSFEKDQSLFSRIKETFESPPSILKESSLGNEIRPIFIVGMPRSGTSLVHQILDSHNKVHGAGELNYLNKFVMPAIKSFKKKGKNQISNKSLKSIRESYLASLSSLNIKEKIIIDKMPLNFRFIGFVASAFPEAKIIHMNRDPMATCWSIYKYYFNGNYYSFDQDDLASYYVLYKDLMDFWKQLFPNQIYDVCYEDLTTNQEEETRNLLEYCELDWDDNCLRFHKNQTVMKTTSALQVRQKMYQGSSEVWRQYESYLQPLIKGLDYYKN